MNLFHNYGENVVKYDLINKFNYKNVNNIPKIDSVTLTFDVRKYNLKTLISALAAIKILSYQTPNLTKSKSSNLSLNIRKGQPIGCKVSLHKNKINKFLSLLINNLPLFETQSNKNDNLFSYKISNILVFDKLEKNYIFFKNLSKLNITITTNSCNNQELTFLLKSNKLV